MASTSSVPTKSFPPESVAAAGSTDWLALLWRRKLIVGFLTGITIILGFLYYHRATPIYESSAQLLLIKNEADLPITGAGNQVSYEDALSTHMILIRSPLIVKRAVERRGLGALNSLKDARTPHTAIIDGLDAVRGGTRDAPDPNVIILSYRGVDPKDCAIILDAVIESYREFLGDTYQSFSDQTVALITRAKDELDRQLSDKEADYRAFREASPHLLTNAQGARTNIHEMRMVDIEEARARQLLENTELRAQIEAIDSAIRRGASREALILLARQKASVSGRAPTDTLERQLVENLLDEQLLLEHYGEDHPDVIAIRKKIEMLRGHVGSFAKVSNPPPADFLAVYLDALREELSIGVQKLAELNDLFSQEQDAAKSQATLQLADETFRNEISRTQLLFDGVIQRLEEIHLVPEQGGVKTQVISPPGMGEQVEPNLIAVLLLATALGLGFGAFTAIVVERTDQRFRSPEDLRRQTGLPIVGHIPVIKPPATTGPNRSSPQKLDPGLCTFDRPEHEAAEAFRAVRTALYFGSRGANHRVIQITSPVPGDGKTTVSANLAISAADSGKNVLLVEADFRRPRLAEMFALEDKPGVGSVISGQAQLSEAIQPTSVAKLSVIPCGPRPANPSELLTSPRLPELFEAVRQQFDLVLVDTPPLLAVTDPAVVAPRVDAVLLVISLGRNVRRVCDRATEILENIEANVLGVVVNRLDRRTDYGSDAYGYEYGYRHQYAHRGGDGVLKKFNGAGSGNGRSDRFLGRGGENA